MRESGSAGVGTCFATDVYLIVVEAGNDVNAVAQDIANRYSATIRFVFPNLNTFVLAGVSPSTIAQIRCEFAVHSIAMDQPGGGDGGSAPPCNIPALSPGVLLRLACAIAFAGAHVIR